MKTLHSSRESPARINEAACCSHKYSTLYAMPCVDYAHAIQIWPKAKRAMKKRKGSRGFPPSTNNLTNIPFVIKESADTYLQCCVPASINGSGRVVHGQRDYVGDDDGHDGSFKTPSIGPIAVNQFEPTPPVQCI